MTLIVPASAGGSTDVIARVLGEHMARTLDRIVVIENVSGGATTVASARTAASAPDGTTVLVAQLPLLAAPFLFTGLSYDTRTAFAPVGLINAGHTVLMARKQLAQSPTEAVAWLRANGTSANIGHGGIGSSGHFCALLLARALGVRPAFIAYRGGGPAMTDLVGGTLDMVCDQSTNAVPQVQAGAVQGILVAGPARIASISAVPTAAELGLPDVSLAVWHGMYVARSTPTAVIGRLNAALGTALADQAIVARFGQLGTSVFPPDQRSPQAHAAMFEAEYQRLGSLLSGMGITPQTVE
ncbi:tripartite tricarboxylate transporter substrate-binding protein [Dankookia rubra]|uniref:tripartite tricarboxylate transporter substrate-binding protein n=1 Tax=Dankookia rubra TaxID=1442381 RepID=UPI00140DA8E7|nr:tripartite tricarboxylate transporter substrate-binding protein [Dankookia rubra]